MRIRLYFDKDGCERHARGYDAYSWDIRTVLRDDDPPTGALFLTELEVEMPPPAECVKVAAAALTAKLAEIRAEAYKEEVEVKERLDKLLALSYTPPETQDDNTF